MVNAGVSLQALMALLGHVSAEMSLRYGRLFDMTVRAEYERALELAKARIGGLPVHRTETHTGQLWRLARGTVHKGPSGRWSLPAGAGPRRLPICQYL